MGPQRGSFTLVAAHHLVDVLAPDPVDVANPDRGQRAALDPVANRLRGQLELARDLLDGEQLLVAHRTSSKASGAVAGSLIAS